MNEDHQSDSTSDEEDSSDQETGPAKRLSLPLALHNLLDKITEENKENIISWVENGTAFKIHDREAFIENILPRFFKTSTFKSFQRSLNLWNFQLVRKGPHKGNISHEFFRRGDRQLSKRIERVIVKGTGKRRTNQKRKRGESTIPSNAHFANTTKSTATATSTAVAGSSTAGSADTRMSGDQSTVPRKVGLKTTGLSMNPRSPSNNTLWDSKQSTTTRVDIRDRSQDDSSVLTRQQSNLPCLPAPALSTSSNSLLDAISSLLGSQQNAGAPRSMPLSGTIAAGAPQNGTVNTEIILSLITNLLQQSDPAATRYPMPMPPSPATTNPTSETFDVLLKVLLESMSQQSRFRTQESNSTSMVTGFGGTNTAQLVQALLNQLQPNVGTQPTYQTQQQHPFLQQAQLQSFPRNTQQTAIGALIQSLVGDTATAPQSTPLANHGVQSSGTLLDDTNNLWSNLILSSISGGSNFQQQQPTQQQAVAYPRSQDGSQHGNINGSSASSEANDNNRLLTDNALKNLLLNRGMPQGNDLQQMQEASSDNRAVSNQELVQTLLQHLSKNTNP